MNNTTNTTATTTTTMKEEAVMTNTTTTTTTATVTITTENGSSFSMELNKFQQLINRLIGITDDVARDNNYWLEQFEPIPRIEDILAGKVTEWWGDKLIP